MSQPDGLPKTPSFDHVGVMGAFVLPEWRRKGIGRRLAEHTLDFARANGYEKIVIYVRLRSSFLPQSGLYPQRHP